MKRIFLCVLVLCLIACGGWYVWHKNKVKDTISTNQNNTQKYFVINEWGVEFLPPSSFPKDDLSYFQPDPENFPDVFRIVSKKYAAVDVICTKDRGGLMSIAREDPRYVKSKIPASFKTVNGYDYYFGGSACQESPQFKSAVQPGYNLLSDAIIKTLRSTTSTN